MNVESSNLMVPSNLVRFISSVRVVLSSAIVVVLAIFVIIVGQAFKQLIDVKHTVDEFTKLAIPSITTANRLYSDINTLTYLSERMADSRSQAELRITFSDVKAHLEQLSMVSAEFDDNLFFKVQLQTVIKELYELQTSVKTQLEKQQQFYQTQQRVYFIYRSLLNKDNILSNQSNSVEYYNWQQEVADVIVPVGEVAQTEHLAVVRALGEKFNEHIAHLKTFVKEHPNYSRSNISKGLENFEENITGPKGIIQLKIDLIQLRGRTKGRSNFMHNLILDYANQAEYNGYKQRLAVEKAANEQRQQLERKIQVISFMAVTAIVTLCVTLWFLHVRVVKRLLVLKTTIKRKLHGEVVKIDTSGNDEIADIAFSFNIYYKTVMQQKEILEELSLSDGLTGVPNRRAFDGRLKSDTHIAKRESWPMSVLMIDVDSFKPYNDNYGHAKGDKCLQAIANTLSNQLTRGTDFIARYGGEEFSCILQNTDKKGAELVARRLVDAVYQANLTHEYSAASDRVTVSIGIACFDYNDKANEQKDIVKCADVALYEAKTRGRNRYVVYSH